MAKWINASDKPTRSGAERAHLLLMHKQVLQNTFMYANLPPDGPPSRQVRRARARANDYWGTAWRNGTLQPGWSTKRMGR